MRDFIGCFVISNSVSVTMFRGVFLSTRSVVLATFITLFVGVPLILYLINEFVFKK